MEIQSDPWRVESVKKLTQAITDHNVALDASDLGTGKMFTALLTAKKLGMKVGVICPMAIIPIWKKAAEKLGVEALFVHHYEKVRNGKCPYGFWIIKRHRFGWNLPSDTLLVFDEVHVCKSQRSQNSKVLMGVRDCRVKALLLSATATQSPLDMKALGYVMRLHNIYDFYSWCFCHGCTQGFLGRLEFKGGAIALAKIHDAIKSRLVRVRISELDDQFPINQIQALAIETGNAKAMDKAYFEGIKTLESPSP